MSVKLSMFDALSIEADPKTKLPYARLPLKFVVEWSAMPTRTSRGLRTVRAGYA